MAYLPVGIVLGCLYALTAVGLAVTYNTSGIFNFAHGAEGMIMAFLYWQLAVGWGVPWPLAMLVVLLVAAPLMGVGIEVVLMRRLYSAPLAVRLVVTLGLLLFLLYVADAIWTPTITRQPPDIVPGSFLLLGVTVTWYQALVLVVSIAVALLLTIFFKQTRAGITMRAVVDDRELAARAGASPTRTSQLSWMLGAFLAALAGIMIVGGRLQQLDQFNLTILVIYGYAAAVVGRLRNLRLTVAGAMLIGLLQAYAVGYLPVNLLTNLEPVIPIVVLFVALLALPHGQLAAARFGGKVRRLTNLRASVALAAAFVLGVWVVSGILSAGNLIYLGRGVVLGIVLLSLVLLTGYGGQVSLCQMTFAGLGAFFMGKLLGGDSIVGLLAAFAIPAATGAALALIVTRLRGIYLALATLAFAYMMENLFFDKQLGVGGILQVGRVGLDSQRAYFLEAAIIFAAFAVVVLALKRGEFGRRLAAVNDSEMASASLGMSVAGTKVVAFALAAGIAGVGGAFYGGWQHVVSPNDFAMLQSLIALLVIAIGGLGSVAGAFFAALFLALNPVIQSHIGDPLGIPNLAFLLVGLGAVSLGRNPSGIAGSLSDVGDWLRARRAEAPAPDEQVPEEVRVRVAG
ncbi:MAG: ABC transporter permease [Acidimicrobiia bacterium]|nr:ABC transporter permease [Acidimicrobiia bacterium]